MDSTEAVKDNKNKLWTKDIIIAGVIIVSMLGLLMFVSGQGTVITKTTVTWNTVTNSLDFASPNSTINVKPSIVTATAGNDITSQPTIDSKLKFSWSSLPVAANTNAITFTVTSPKQMHVLDSFTVGVPVSSDGNFTLYDGVSFSDLYRTGYNVSIEQTKTGYVVIARPNATMLSTGRLDIDPDFFTQSVGVVNLTGSIDCNELWAYAQFSAWGGTCTPTFASQCIYSNYTINITQGSTLFLEQCELIFRYKGGASYQSFQNFGNLTLIKSNVTWNSTNHFGNFISGSPSSSYTKTSNFTAIDSYLTNIFSPAIHSPLVIIKNLSVDGLFGVPLTFGSGVGSLILNDFSILNNAFGGIPVVITVNNVTAYRFRNFGTLQTLSINPAHNFTCIDCNLTTTFPTAIGVGNSKNVVFLNTSYPLSKETLAAGSELERKWYLLIYVNSTTGIPVAGATITSFSNMSFFIGVTNATGWLNATVQDYKAYGTTRRNTTNITATFGSAAKNLSYYGATDNNINNYITLDMTGVGYWIQKQLIGISDLGDLILAINMTDNTTVYRVIKAYK